MCGIFAVYNYWSDAQSFRQRALYLSKKIRHRGPDWSGCKISGNNILCHERLAIVGVDSGAQPLTNHSETIILSVNGEIYNHKALRKLLTPPYLLKTQSDCEIIVHLYNQIGSDLCKLLNSLDGIFSFVLYDKTANRLIAARDAIGVTTLYYGYNSKHPETLFFASEMKSLHEDCDRILSFPPGHVYDSNTGQITRWYDPIWWDNSRIATSDIDYSLIRKTFEAAVRKRLMSEVPYGVLLSGGLDSSLVASIAARETQKLLHKQFEYLQRPKGDSSSSNSSGDESSASWPRLHSFSIGLPGSPDLMAAREVAHFLRTQHHEYNFTIEEGLDAIPDVIYHLETYDVTTVRASTPMYLLSRRIKAMGVKMVLSGEGSDEMFGGYLYFHSAPDANAFHAETVSRVKNLHTSDCLRANKSTLAWGLEARVPFLDKAFLDLVMDIEPTFKMCSKDRIEKYILRKAFDTSDNPKADPYLPDSILWRQKEQFSDGVGYSWIDSLKAEAESKVTDEVFAKRETRWPHDTPQTKEAYWYREVFEHWYPEPACTESVVRWFPRADWGCPSDPSGRAQKAHSEAYTKNSVKCG